MRTIAIGELGSSNEIPLSQQQWKALRDLRFRPRDGNELRPVFEIVAGRTPDRFQIRANSIVGVVRMPGLEIVVSPKCGARNLAYMLNVGESRVHVDDELVGLAIGGLIKYLAKAYLKVVDVILHDGLIEDYVTVRRSDSRPKGRIEFGRFGNGLPLPVTYTHDEFTSDGPENQLICAALTRLGDTLEGGSREASRARSMRNQIEVSPLSIDPASVTPRPRYSNYKNAISLAKIILQSGGVEPRAGHSPSNGILFDMTQVYEDFISQSVEGMGPLIGAQVDLQGKSLPSHLAITTGGKNILGMHPDFTVWDGNAALIVGDVKYKNRGAYAARPDLYQMFAYTEALNCPKGLLIYVGKSSPAQLSFAHGAYFAKTTILSLDLEAVEPWHAQSTLLNVIQTMLKDSPACARN